MALTKAVRRWRDGMQVSHDADYCTRLETLSAGSVRRNFNPYLDIPWDSHLHGDRERPALGTGGGQ